MKISQSGFLAVFIFLIITTASGQKGSLFQVKDLHVTWQLLTNNYEQKPENLCSFKLENTGRKTIPAKGWTLYFNLGRQINPASVTGNVKITHVNGDIYSLKPGTDDFNIKPGKSADITFISEGEILNYISSPGGYYLVFDSHPGKGYSLSGIKDMPVADSTVHFVTAADTYKENENVRDIPLEELPPVLPTPVSCKKLDGNFIFGKGTAVIAIDAFKQEAAYLKSEMFPEAVITGESHSVTGPGIFLEIADLPLEAYHLKIMPDAVHIAASSGAGIFYGIQSLRMLIPPAVHLPATEAVTVPCMEIKDSPRFGLRSQHIDVARNFQTKEQLEQVIDLLALYKLNTLHLHFIDDEGWRIEIVSLPELTQVGANRGHTLDSKEFLPPSYNSGPDTGRLPASGYYSRADFIEILKYAKARHIEVVPEIETPGHSRAAIKAMDARYEKYHALGNEAEATRYLLRDPDDQSEYLSPQLWTDNVMCVAMPSVYAFLEKVIDELRAMYAEANAPLNTIHMGGDEVPNGTWEKSPLCQALIQKDPAINNVDDLWYYYFSKVNEILRSRHLILSGWEEIAMRKTMLDGQKHFIPNPQFVNEGFHVDVWNNGIGWGSEDLPYRLANAGYKVILSCVSNQYFDLAYEKSPDEPGLYWGGFHDTDKPFYFIPFDYYRNTKEDTGGNPVSPSLFTGKDHLTDYGKSNILGIQGLLWAENIRNRERRDYMLLPKLLALSERAWAADPEWANEKDEEKAGELYNEAWSVFVNEVGKRELIRLSNLNGGYKYRVPPPGAIAGKHTISANCQLPGVQIRYTEDGTDPTLESKLYTGPIPAQGMVKMATFSVDGRRGRVISVGGTVK